MQNICKAWTAGCAALVMALCAGNTPAAEVGAPGASSAAALIQRLGLEEAPAPVRDSPQWRKPEQVLVWNVAPQAAPALQAAAPGVKLLLAKDATEAVSLARVADAVLGFCSAELLAAGPGTFPPACLRCCIARRSARFRS